jgi:hypothetical protein
MRGTARLLPYGLRPMLHGINTFHEIFETLVELSPDFWFHGSKIRISSEFLDLWLSFTER